MFRIVTQLGFCALVPKHLIYDSLDGSELNVLFLFVDSFDYILELDVSEHLPNEGHHLDDEVSPAVALPIQCWILDESEEHADHRHPYVFIGFEDLIWVVQEHFGDHF